MYYEEFPEGASLATHGRTITETDVVLFATLTGAQNPLFLDAEFGKSTVFGTRLVPGLLTLSMVVGLAYQLPQGPFGEGFIALLDLAFATPKPVRIGDTIRARVEVTAKEPPRDGKGRVRLHFSARNQREEEVLTADARFLVRVKGT